MNMTGDDVVMRELRWDLITGWEAIDPASIHEYSDMM